MTEILTKVRAIRTRILLGRFLGFLVLCSVVGVSLLVVVLTLERLFALNIPLAQSTVLISATTFIVAVLLTFTWKRPTLGQAAVLADRRLGLKTRLSSALSLSNVDGPMAAATVEDARIHAERIDPARAFPLTSPRGIQSFLICTAFLPMTFFIPQLDLLDLEQEREEELVQKTKIEKVIQNFDRRKEELKKEARLQGMEGLLEELDNLELLADELNNAENPQLKALQKLQQLRDRLESKRQLAANNRPTSPTQLPKDSPLHSLSKALEEGDAEQARKELEKLKKRLTEGNLDPKDMQELAQDLQELAKALDSRSGLGKALAEMGMNLKAGDLASAMASLELSEEDLKALEELWKQADLLDDALKNIDAAAARLGKITEICKDCLTGDCEDCGEGEP